MSSPDLRAFAQSAPLTYGTWGRFKSLYKQLEVDPFQDAALFGALAARIDAAPLSNSFTPQPVRLGRDVRSLAGIAVRGEFVYLLAGYAGRTDHLGVYQFDAADPLRPARRGKVTLNGGHAVFLCGQFVCVLAGQPTPNVLQVYDVADPANPVLRGQIGMDGALRAVGVFPYVYVAVGRDRGRFSGLHIVDVSKPDRPELAGEIEIKGATAVAKEGTISVVTVGKINFGWGQLPQSSGIRVLEVKNPRQARVLGSLNLGDVQAVAMRGRVAFVGVQQSGPSEPNGLQIVDLTNPARPLKLGFCAMDQPPKAITVSGDFLYVTPSYGRQAVIDVRDPNKPVLTAQMSVSSGIDTLVSRDVAFVPTPYSGLELYSVQNPARPTRIGAPPSGATLGYMKRRVRRRLRTLAATDSERYVRLASEVLAAVTAETIDPRLQWVLADILYGGSDRYAQKRHGRGPLVQQHSRFLLRRREERAPEGWDRHPELLTALLTNPALPWQTYEFAFRALRAVKQMPASVPETLLERCASSPSPLLIHYATRQVAARIGQGGFPAGLAAAAYVKAGKRLRQVIESRLALYAGNESWNRDFVKRILDLASVSIQGETLPRRTATACALVARHFPNVVHEDVVRAMTAPLLNAALPGLTDLVLGAARRDGPDQTLFWLQRLELVAEPRREPVVQALAQGLRDAVFTLEMARAFVHSGSAFIREAGWRLLAASRTPRETIKPLWTELLESFVETAALSTAMSSPSALALLDRAGFGATEIGDRLRDRPFLVGLLSPQTFATVTQSVPAAVTLTLIAAASDAQWQEFRNILVRSLHEGVGLEDFWRSAENAFASDATGGLEARLLADPEIAATFALVDDPGLLGIREPAFGPLLAAWAVRHQDLFSVNSALLLEAATHVLPEVRAWALARVGTLGMGLPFALRLLESSLPASMDAGRAFFERLPHGDRQEQTYALALCDSPFLPVRALGRQFVTARRATLPQEAILQALFENAHADMQAFVAEVLEKGDTHPTGATEFDREVLRSRQKGRRAKEAIKSRQNADPTVDAATLLALARSRTPRDAEWALGQLAKMALAGQEIEGVTVEGVPGV